MKVPIPRFPRHTSRAYGVPWDRPGPVVRAGLAWAASRQEHLRAGASCVHSLLCAVELGVGVGWGAACWWSRHAGEQPV